MNRQVSYIVYASLWLLLAAVISWFIEMLPASQKHTAGPAFADINPKESLKVLSTTAAKGKTVFMQKCASCHNLYKKILGPGLAGFTQKEPWTIRQNVYDWIRNPPAFMERNEYARKLKEEYVTPMQAFPDLTNEEIDAICIYVEEMPFSPAPVIAKK